MAPTVATERDALFFMHMILCMKSPTIETDWDEVASRMGLKNAGVAKTRYGQIRRKYLDSGAAASCGSSTPSTPKKASPKRKKVVKEEIEDDMKEVDSGEGMDPSPSKKSKTEDEQSVKTEVKDEEDVRI